MFDILDLDAVTDEVIQADNEKMTNVSITEDGTRINNVRHSTIDRVNGILTANETISIQKNNTQNQVNNTCSLQIYTMDELGDILSQNGFKIVEQFNVDAYTFCEDAKGYSILTAAMKE